MFKKVTQSLLALLMLVQILVPTATAFASETETYDDDYVYGDAIELDGEDLDLDIEMDEAWANAELSEWAELLEANEEVRDQSVELYEMTQDNEAALALHSIHTQLYEEAVELREDDVFELEFAVAAEALTDNTEAFEALVEEFEALLEAEEATPEVEDVVDEEAAPEVDDVIVEEAKPEVPEENEVAVTPATMHTVTVVGGASNAPGATSFQAEAGQSVRVWRDLAIPSGHRVTWASNVSVTFTDRTNGWADFVMPNGNVTITMAFVRNTGRLTVTRGTGGRTNAGAGVAVNISATVPTGYVFSHWTRTGAFGTFGNSSSRSTTFTPSATLAQGFTTTVTPVFRPRRRTSSPTMNIRAQAVVNANTSLRSGPGTQYHPSPFLGSNQTGRMNRGATVTVLNRGGSWSYVRASNGRWGWLPNSRLTRHTRTGIITTSGTRLRNAPNTGSRRLATLSRNTQVTILAEGGSGRIGWVQVQAGRRTGWVQRRDINEFTQVRRTRQSVVMRRGPGGSFSRVRNVGRGRDLTVLGRSGSWLYVQLGRTTGWVPNSRTASRTQSRTLRAFSSVNRGSTFESARNSWWSSGRGTTRVTVTGRARHVDLGGLGNQRWSQVRFANGRTGWVLSSSLR